MRYLTAILVATFLAILAVSTVSAQTPPTFKLGFKALADQIPDVVGAPTENEHFNPSNGNSEQHTTKGLMVWRKADNWTAFTNGYMTWINGPYGLQSRLNTARFPWEGDGGTSASPPPAPAPTSGYEYVDPRLLAANPNQYVGKKVIVEGDAGTVEQPGGYTWMQIYAEVRGRTYLWESLVVHFTPPQTGILRGDSYRVYGTVVGTENVVRTLTGATNTVTQIDGDRYEAY